MVNMILQHNEHSEKVHFIKRIQDVIWYLGRLSAASMTEIKLIVHDQEKYNQLCCVCDEYGREQMIVILE